MSKLSNLEKRELSELYKLLRKSYDSYVKESDNIEDFLCEQFNVKCDDYGDTASLVIARDHCTLEKDNMLQAYEIIKLLHQHFGL